MGPPKILVFGGNGFVGSRVCEEAVKTGLGVVSINRSGPPKLNADWVSKVEWVRVSSMHLWGPCCLRLPLSGPACACSPSDALPCAAQADVFDTAAWRGQLSSSIGVISCLGAFGSNAFMQKVLDRPHPAYQQLRTLTSQARRRRISPQQ